MKKIILIITITSILLSCSNGGNSSSSNTPTTGNNVDYEFTITVNGLVNKIKGNTANGIPIGQNSPYSNLYHYVTNQCTWSSNYYLTLTINDVSAPNFVSGQNLQCQILLSNAMLGTSQGSVLLSGGAFDSIASSVGAAAWSYSYTYGATSSSSILDKLPINITDLGAIPTSNGGLMSGFGNTFKGNYSGTLYLARQYINSYGNTAIIYDIPVQISIDFKAVRLG